MATIWLQRNPGDQVEGPYSEDQIRSLGAGRRLMSHALVSIDGQPWAPASQISGVVLNKVGPGEFLHRCGSTTRADTGR